MSINFKERVRGGMSSEMYWGGEGYTGAQEPQPNSHKPSEEGTSGIYLRGGISQGDEYGEGTQDSL